MSLREDVQKFGFSIIPAVLSQETVACLFNDLAKASLRRSRAGVRHALSYPPVAALARDSRLLAIAQEILGCTARPFHATLFDKSSAANWLVPWHQDTALPLRERRETQGWGPWSVKDGVNYAHAPARALFQVLALRVHLDDSTSRNGPLRVLPETHTRGVLSDDAIHELAAQTPLVECAVPQGGVLAMRPLLVHSSSKSQADIPRRVLHIEYAASDVALDGLELLRA